MIQITPPAAPMFMNYYSAISIAIYFCFGFTYLVSKPKFIYLFSLDDAKLYI